MRIETLASHRRVLESRLFQPEASLGALHCDSRRCDARTGFLALPGLRTDGHRFVDAALAAGAPALFVSRREVFERIAAHPTPHLSGVFLVQPDRRVLAELAGDLHGWPDRNLTLLGVTGTNGKTTVTHLVAQMLAALGRDCAVAGTLGLCLGGKDVRPEPAAAGQGFPAGNTTPEAPDLHAFFHRCLENGTSTVAMEVSSHGLVMERTWGMTFAAAGFTNLSQDHLDFHGSMEAYREAKFGLFFDAPRVRPVANVDDPAGKDLVARWNLDSGSGGRGRRALAPAFTVSLEEAESKGMGADLSLTDLRREGGGMAGTLVLREGGAPFRAPFHLPMLGRFNLSNWLVAAGMLLAAGKGGEGGLPEDFGLTDPALELARAAKSCTGAPGRFERVPLDAPFTVIVDYAHTPDALENLLATARELAGEVGGRLRVAFGAGGDRDREKRPLMGAAAERWADAMILTNDNPRSEDPETILAEIATGLKGRVPAASIADRREAIAELLAQAAPGDVIVIAGKGDEPYQEIAGVKHPFDDRKVVRDWAGARGLGAGEEG